jgi:tetratricopeptide (TPR) repeat protein
MLKESRMLSSTWTNRSLIVLLAALPVAPVVWDYVYPGSYAKWLLADAANQYDNGQVERAQRLLLRAYELSPEISSDANFWRQLGRIELSPENPVSEDSIWSAMVRKIPTADQRAVSAVEIALLMLDRKMYSHALVVLREFLPTRELRSPLQNNLIAYTRALAEEELDEALQDINAAVSRLENESLLDTKAWVLHQLGRDREALEEIDRSIDMLFGKIRVDSSFDEVLPFLKEILAGGKPAAEKPAERAADGVVDQQNDEEAEKMGVGWAHQSLLEKFPRIAIDIVFQNMATLRYHRWKILKALQEAERAEQDFRWLEAFSPEPWDSLD